MMENGRARWEAVLPTATAIALGLGALAMAWLFARPLGILVLAITLAQALSPTVDRLHTKMPRGAAILIVYAALAAVAFTIGWFVVPILAGEAQQLIKAAPDLVSRLQQWMSKWDHQTGGELSSAMSSGVRALTGRLVSIPFGLATAAFDLFVVVFLSIYWLLAQPHLHRFVVSLSPADRQHREAHVLSAMGVAIGGYVRGVAIDAAIVGGIAWVALALAGIQFPLVLGVITMVGELVPYVGPTLSGAAAVAVALLQSPQKAVIAFVLYVALVQLEGHIIAPNIMRSQTDLSPVMVLFAFFAGAAIGGVLGAIVAIPFAAGAQVIVLEVLVPAVKRRTGAASAEPEQ
jgi:predicted PurR-regulated permease PerM